MVSTTPSSSHLSSALVWALRGLEFLQECPCAPLWGASWAAGDVCSHVVSSLSCRGYLLCHGAVPPPLFSDFGAPVLKYVFPEVSLAWLRGSAVFCSGSVGADCVPHGLFPLLQPLLCQQLAAYTLNTE